MNKLWLATFHLNPDLAKKLIETQFPELHSVTLEFIGEGWDNVVYRVNHDYVFRFPRRQLGADLVDTEWKILPHLIGLLPLPIPEPLFYGKPTSEFPWHFLGYRFLQGQSACAARLSIDERIKLAKPLAQFLKALHAIDQAQALSFGAQRDDIGKLDDMGKLDVEKRWPVALQNIEKIRELGLFDQCDALVALLHDLKDVRDTGPKTLIHSDLYARHLLVDEHRALSGVIDWGDIRIANPATDLVILFSFLPKSAHHVFLDEYGPIDEQTRQLALMRELYHSSAIVLYSHEIGDKDLLDESLFGLHLLVQHCPT